MVIVLDPHHAIPFAQDLLRHGRQSIQIIWPLWRGVITSVALVNSIPFVIDLVRPFFMVT